MLWCFTRTSGDNPKKYIYVEDDLKRKKRDKNVQVKQPSQESATPFIAHWAFYSPTLRQMKYWVKYCRTPSKTGGSLSTSSTKRQREKRPPRFLTRSNTSSSSEVFVLYVISSEDSVRKTLMMRFPFFLPHFLPLLKPPTSRRPWNVKRLEGWENYPRVAKYFENVTVQNTSSWTPDNFIKCVCGGGNKWGLIAWERRETAGNIWVFVMINEWWSVCKLREGH